MTSPVFTLLVMNKPVESINFEVDTVVLVPDSIELGYAISALSDGCALNALENVVLNTDMIYFL